MTSHDLEYYMRREREERDRAAGTEDHGARMIHLELAKRYRAMLPETIAASAPAATA